MNLVFALKLLKINNYSLFKKIDKSGYYTGAAVVIRRRITRISSTEYSKYYASHNVLKLVGFPGARDERLFGGSHW